MLISTATAFASIFVYSKYFAPRQAGPYQNGSNNIPVNYTSYMPGTETRNATPPTDFQQAAKIALPGVVHIKTKINPRQVTNNLQRRRSILQDLFGDDFFGDEFQGEGGGRRYYIPGQMASGSGVLISDDGYIVTNNHVVDQADEINVTLNNYKTYKAKVVGVDPNTDLAVIKIDVHNAPYLLYGNSDDVQVGQWVLAVGYPLNLETTVTAGIVSAKARTIGINKRNHRSAIESFIQTDAAVNQGNSGGALINTAGELIGINSAIASPTGAYAGYSYAIPVNLVKKVVNDLMKYGNVQRAYLGINYIDPMGLSDEELRAHGIRRDLNGVMVQAVPGNGAAAAAGIEKGDIITKINGVSTPSIPEMTEQIARYKPGDKISISYLRDNKEYTVNNVLLKNEDGTTDIIKTSVLDKLGADLISLEKADAARLGIRGGVYVNNVGSGLLKRQTNMKSGFVILKAGGQAVTSVDDLKKVLQKQSKVQLEGMYPDYTGVYYYNIDLNGEEAF
ncbi:MAG TPA: trypsin-like peptidase domain-containing protein [Chitinophaga sp.]|uniref:trypsin-like peptidase domain-containing protein n=1 Tax=Chitinophaga sp. TaxID=1869181 RepID=UPI002DB62CC3|nr:trypsin-like peptidase domain-containing protein [Chitinophaga sp.]HEU4552266.1 trypsin-like peptidase domain-containing protein [Chitinophaga sp.]